MLHHTYRTAHSAAGGILDSVDIMDHLALLVLLDCQETMETMGTMEYLAVMGQKVKMETKARWDPEESVEFKV